MADDTDVQAYAEEMAAAFERATRPDGTPFTRLKEGPRKEEYTEIVYAVHRALDQALPADSTFEEIETCITAIAEAEDPEAPYLEADPYTANLLDWLKDDLSRLDLVNKALAEQRPPDLFAAMQSAQVREMEQICESLLSSIRERLDSAEGEEE